MLFFPSRKHHYGLLFARGTIHMELKHCLDYNDDMLDFMGGKPLINLTALQYCEHLPQRLFTSSKSHVSSGIQLLPVSIASLLELGRL
jgi:hypothetical protein